MTRSFSSTTKIPNTGVALPRAHRAYSTGGSASSGGGSGFGTFALVGLAAAAGGAYYFQDDLKKAFGGAPAAPPKPLDYQEVYNAIADLLDNADYDDGSYGPVLVRLAWHASGTYDKNSKTGGSNGATMRFDPEASHGANAGLAVARKLLEPIKAKFPQISYSDLWTLAGVVAIQEMGGPVIPWRPGRADAETAAACTPDGRLPDAAKGQDHIRDIFYRMGFNDQEIVALAGAHALGRCHTDRSGFEGPWTRSPITFSNDYFKNLLQERWTERKWSGPKQFADKTGDLMMLPADIAFIKDRSFYKYVTTYAKDSDAFFKDFSAAFGKLLELGVPFPEDAKVYNFKPSA
ncbi:peroxidase [Zopfochytrium polystomum]|nr:peroxidase [Zopfochytrium polystomum]